MEAKEIRIGNYYNHNGEILKITPNDIQEVWEAKRGWCKPVPLTAEWLVKFGFTPDEHNLLYDHPSPMVPEDEHKDLGTTYPSFFFNKRLNRWMDCHTRVCINYVHQLQNLYFALTGEELTTSIPQ